MHTELTYNTQSYNPEIFLYKPWRPKSFYPSPDEVGAGGISVASDVRPARRLFVRISFIRIAFWIRGDGLQYMM